MDATALAAAVRAKKVSPSELVEAAIQRIEAENGQLNAVVHKQYAAARQQAANFLVQDQPFAGVPLLLKDLGQQQAGQLATAGSRLLAHTVAQQTDYLVQAFEALGFIILGRTNTPEFGFKNISDSQLHGPVQLPFDHSRNAGGSSGGAGAAVAAGWVPVAGASDGGGSIRIPASFNGLIGLKPSRGRLPVGPTAYRGWQGASVHFALTQSVRDTRQLLWGMQVCQLASPFPLPCLSRAQLWSPDKRRLRIAYTTASPIQQSVSSAAVAAVEKAVDFLRAEGHEVIALDRVPYDAFDLMASYYIMNGVETAQMFDDMAKHLGRALTPEDMELMTWAIFQSGRQVPATTYSKILQDWDQLTAQGEAFHQTYDLLLTPTTAQVAPPHGQFDLAPDLADKLLHLADYELVQQQALIWEMFEASLAWTPLSLIHI